MSTVDSTGTTRGSTHPIVAELIRDEIANWFGQQHPYPDVKETISSEALASMLHRVADRAFSVGSASDPEPTVADILRENDAETMLCQIGAIFSAIDAMANDRDSQFDAESAQWLVTLGRDLVRRLLPAGDAP